MLNLRFPYKKLFGGCTMFEQYTTLDCIGDVVSILPVSQQLVGGVGVPLNCAKLFWHTSILIRKHSLLWMQSIGVDAERMAKIQLKKKMLNKQAVSALNSDLERIIVNIFRIIPIVGTLTSAMRLGFNTFVFLVDARD
ncbi:hypothetical protein DB43_DO00130 [Parachlamydia acanthamoebae]|uniref:Uncharacterized protein n=2 Tax=Parachlamydiaceae TaxID=92713 RepID=A0A0C1CCY3_9BACT|nr:hypothetical protein DB43_DO00130 [Parachlamydia acanthamoebae]